VLQKSKVAELRIFAKNPIRDAIADSYNLNRATEVAPLPKRERSIHAQTAILAGADRGAVIL
jgi:hypothetical protein